MSRSTRTRWALFCLGWIFFALGVVGAVLPVVPTTPFMLLALWAFSRSSERFHHWLRHHRIFGPPLQRWDRERVVPLWAKVVAIGSMLASLCWVAFGMRARWYAVAATAAVMLTGAAYVLRFPSRSSRSALPEGEVEAP
ncbi:MAG TPA: YbaN family protein [Anaeromyxobacteraceae bacterium]|nr:YbaN family protein [Anaeromyxobacteraceae bacterium]